MERQINYTIAFLFSVAALLGGEGPGLFLNLSWVTVSSLIMVSTIYLLKSETEMLVIVRVLIGCVFAIAGGFVALNITGYSYLKLMTEPPLTLGFGPTLNTALLLLLLSISQLMSLNEKRHNSRSLFYGRFVAVASLFSLSIHWLVGYAAEIPNTYEIYLNAHPGWLVTCVFALAGINELRSFYRMRPEFLKGDTRIRPMLSAFLIFVVLSGLIVSLVIERMEHQGMRETTMKDSFTNELRSSLSEIMADLQVVSQLLPKSLPNADFTAGIIKRSIAKDYVDVVSIDTENKSLTFHTETEAMLVNSLMHKIADDSDLKNMHLKPQIWDRYLLVPLNFSESLQSYLVVIGQKPLIQQVLDRPRFKGVEVELRFTDKYETLSEELGFGLRASFEKWKTVGEEKSKIVELIGLFSLVIVIGVFQTHRRRLLLEQSNEQLNIQKDALDKAKRAAVKANNAKSRFLANMSHEIRTPLSAIIGYCELISMDAKLDKNFKIMFDSVLRNSRHLSNLVNEVLDLSKIEAGNMPLTPVVANIEKTFEDLNKSCQPLIAGKRTTINFELNDVNNCWLKFDEQKYRQIVINLISNAIKYAGENAIQVSVMTQNGHLITKVSDQGTGISKEMQRVLFQPFVQGDSSANKTQPGTGLGLAFSRSLAALMGGELDLVKSTDSGSTFRLVVPVVHVDDLVQEKVAGEKSTAKKRVLIVDDSEDNRFIIKSFLESHHDIQIAEDGLKAIDIVSNDNALDLVLLDIQMPVMDGMEVARKLRQDLGFKGKIFALTANAIAEEADKCLKSGFDKYLTKPVSRTSLLFEIDEVPVNLPLESNTQKILNQARGVYIRVTNERIEKIADALVLQDMATIKSIAHQIKGTVKTFGYQEQARLIYELEKTASAENFQLCQEVYARFKEQFELDRQAS